MKRIVFKAANGQYQIVGLSTKITQNDEELPLNVTTDLQRVFALTQVKKGYVVYQEMKHADTTAPESTDRKSKSGKGV